MNWTWSRSVSRSWVAVPRPVLAIGEVKWGRTLGQPDLDRLDRLRGLLRRRPGVAAEQSRLVLSSGAGFSDRLVASSNERPDVLLVDPERLYGGE